MGKNQVRETYRGGVKGDEIEGNSEEMNKRSLVTDVKVPFSLSMDNFR